MQRVTQRDRFFSFNMSAKYKILYHFLTIQDQMDKNMK